jgi:hypothetical protein
MIMRFLRNRYFTTGASSLPATLDWPNLTV